MANRLTKLNRIPVPTWSWLHVNEAELHRETPEFCEYKKPFLTGDDQEGLTVTSDVSADELSAVPFSLAEEAQSLLSKPCAVQRTIHIEKGASLSQPVVLDFELDETSPTLLDNIAIVAEENSCATIVIRYHSSKELAEGFHVGATRIYAKSGSAVSLFKIQLLGERCAHLDSVGGFLESDAFIGYCPADLGASEAVSGSDFLLDGHGAGATTETIYMCEGDQKLDFNHRIVHKAPHSNSTMNANGVLMGRSHKVFRGTIDFMRGSRGSKGSEVEFTTLLSPLARNLSVPLLLSGESDVEGTHAASTGRIDESKLFYLMSRGLSETDAKKLIVEAAFSPYLAKLPTEALREEVSDFVRRHLDNA